MVPLADTYFANLSDDAGHDSVVIWEQEIARAEQRRQSDVSEMDIMASRPTNPIDITSTESVQFMTETGQREWVGLGVDIEDKQCVFPVLYHAMYSTHSGGHYGTGFGVQVLKSARVIPGQLIWNGNESVASSNYFGGHGSLLDVVPLRSRSSTLTTKMIYQMKTTTTMPFGTPIETMRHRTMTI
jgi:hypothetical protein